MNLDELLDNSDAVKEKEAAKAVLGKYSWEKTAGELVKLFDRYAG